MLGGGLCCLCAQTASDALRYSQLEASSTARTAGIGGAIGALGADFATTSINPAGLAMFRSSELIFSPSLARTKVVGTLKGSGNAAQTERKSSFGIANLAAVIATKPKSKRWKTFNIGIGMNCLATFKQRSYYEGASVGSITDRFVEQANAGVFSDFESAIANDALAIFKNQQGIYISDFTDYGGSVTKNQSIATSGGINELTFSFAGNYKEKLMIGATLGVPLLSFSEDKLYQETDPSGTIPFFKNLKYQENLTTDGAGVNLKFGLIYRPVQSLRFGLAVHSPTLFRLTDNYSATITYEYEDLGQTTSTEKKSPIGSFDYRLTTPFRAIGSAGFLFGKRGFLSGEIEWLDYTAATFDLLQASEKAYEREINNNIAKRYQTAVNFRIGGEVVFDILRLRAGLGLLGSPYVGDSKVSPTYSTGIGIRESDFYVDLAYQYRQTQEGYKPYLVSDADRQPIADQRVTNNNFLLTFGYKF